MKPDADTERAACEAADGLSGESIYAAPTSTHTVFQDGDGQPLPVSEVLAKLITADQSLSRKAMRFREP